MRKDSIRRVGRSLAGAIIFLMIILICSTMCTALQPSQEDYERTIEKNNAEIEQCETIKAQLHNTAEEMRKQEYYNEEFVNTLSKMWLSQDAHQKSLIEANERLKEAMDSFFVESSNKKFIGYFKITHYCNCSKCCGKWAGGATASGTIPEEGRTIAVDPKVIPLGSHVEIDGIDGYIAEDTGGVIKGNIIDLAYMTYDECIQFGRRNMWVYFLEK